jgi:hypothetical protein
MQAAIETEYNVDRMFDELIEYSPVRKRYRTEFFKRSIHTFFSNLDKGVVYSDEELMKIPYYFYVLSCYQMKQWDNVATRRKCLKSVQGGVTLFHDIKTNGIQDPIPMVIRGSKVCMLKGARRLVISKVLKKKTVPVRITVDEQF